jgi:hypothetical protein
MDPQIESFKPAPGKITLETATERSALNQPTSRSSGRPNALAIGWPALLTGGRTQAWLGNAANADYTLPELGSLYHYEKMRTS